MNDEAANLCDLGGAWATLRHLLAHQMAEGFMKKPKRALADCDRYFMSPDSVPCLVPEGGGTAEEVAAIAAGLETERQRMHVSVRARLEQRLKR
ncbi:hypothetical protein ACSSVZ_001937 [Amorphus sp. MBR-141]